MKNKFIKFHRLFRQNLITSEDHGGAIEDARSCTCKHCCEFFFVNPDRLKEQSHEIKVWFFWAKWVRKIILIFLRKGFSSLYKRFNQGWAPILFKRTQRSCVLSRSL